MGGDSGGGGEPDELGQGVSAAGFYPIRIARAELLVVHRNGQRRTTLSLYSEHDGLVKIHQGSAAMRAAEQLKCPVVRTVRR